MNADILESRTAGHLGRLASRITPLIHTKFSAVLKLRRVVRWGRRWAAAVAAQR